MWTLDSIKEFSDTYIYAKVFKNQELLAQGLIKNFKVGPCYYAITFDSKYYFNMDATEIIGSKQPCSYILNYTPTDCWEDQKPVVGWYEIDIDVPIQNLVKALNMFIPTQCSCCGHNKEPAWVSFPYYADLELLNNILEGIQESSSFGVDTKYCYYGSTRYYTLCKGEEAYKVCDRVANKLFILAGQQ